MPTLPRKPVNEVASWLNSLGQSHRAPVFLENGIERALLLSLDERGLEEIGIHSLAARKLVAEAINRLREPGAIPPIPLDGLAELPRPYSGDLGVPGGLKVREVMPLDDNLLAGIGESGGVALWLADTGWRMAHLPGHDAPVVDIAPVSGASLLLGWTKDGHLLYWDMRTGRRLKVVRVHDDGVRGLALSPDGWMVTWSGDGQLRSWDTLTGEMLTNHDGHRGLGVNGAAVLGGGQFVSWGDDGAVRHWQVEVKGALHAMVANDLPVTEARLYGRRLLAWSHYDHMRLWGIDDGSALAVLDGQPMGSLRIIAPDNDRMITIAADGRLRLIDRMSGSILRASEAALAEVRRLFPFPGGRALSWAAEGRLDQWDMEALAPVVTVPCPAEPFAVAQFGAAAVMACRDGNVRFYEGDGTTPKVVDVAGLIEPKGCIALDPDRVLIWSENRVMVEYVSRLRLGRR